MPVSKQKMMVILVLGLLILGISFYYYGEKNSPPAAMPQTVHGNGNGEDRHADHQNGEVVVYISGAVVNPGLYKLAPGSRVADVVTSAGGLTADADKAKINLAEKIKDGSHIHILSLSAVVPGAADSPPAAGRSSAARTAVTADEKVNINTADKAELDKLPGVGPGLAERIIEYRQTNGGFTDIAQLRKVSGIGEAKFRTLKDKVTL